MRPTIALGLLGAVLAGSAASAEDRNFPRFGAFRAWIVGCDNLRDCRAMGFRARGGEPRGALIIDRAGAPEAPPSLRLGLGNLLEADSGLEDGVTVEVSADGTRLGALVVGSGLVAADAERSGFDIEDAAVRQAILEATRRARILRFALPGAAEPIEISLEGASAALLFMDDRQLRLDTVTALVRRGTRPASDVPAPPALPELPEIARDPAWQPTPARVPDAVLQRIRPPAQECFALEDDAPIDATAIGRLGADLVLVQVLCWRGAYNEGYRLIAWNDRTGEVTPLAFPVPEGLEDDTRAGTLTNPDFDTDRLSIGHLSKGRGIGDCGSTATWRWDGRAFQLARYEYMPECQGFTPGDWLELHRSR